MCGTYQLSSDDNAEIRAILDEIDARPSHPTYKQGTLFPTDNAPVLLWEDGRATPEVLGWGFPAFSDKKHVINARVETARIKPLFSASLESRRCIIPASGFFEFDATHARYLFRLSEQDALYMAGVYKDYMDNRQFCILTTEANDSVSKVHPRMPLLFTRDVADTWLSDPAETDTLLHSTPPELEAIKSPTSSQESLF